jgi:hypothetical protein
MNPEPPVTMIASDIFMLYLTISKIAAHPRRVLHSVSIRRMVHSFLRVNILSAKLSSNESSKP